MKVSLNEVKIGDSVKVELKKVPNKTNSAFGEFKEFMGEEMMPREYKGELIEIQETLFALRKGETIMIFDTELYDIFDEKKDCLIINFCFEGRF